LPWAEDPRVGRLRAVARELGAPLAELAVRWCARTAHPIVGARTPAEGGAIGGIAPLDDERASRLEEAAASR
jgi:aryl-alcohol dehydrogenase-like predicted oxidoreductase